MTRILFGLLALLCLCAPAQAVPTWGARASSPADTAPAALKPGEWIWGGDDKALGPMAVVVSLTEQRAYVYRNGIGIGVSTVSTGKPGHETPTGVFTILQKDKDHRSSKYNNAPMPYQERLTLDGIALHAGGLPGFPESHGCVHLPTEFARLLFGATNMGMTVVIAQQGRSPANIVHPTALIPVDPKSGADAAMPPLDDGQPFRWHPERAPTGAVSMVLSTSDQRVFVYRDGVEIGRSRVLVRDPADAIGTHAYLVGKDYMPGDVPGLPGVRMPAWTAIGIPGHADEAGKPLDAKALDRIVVPPGFLKALLPLLAPGSVLLATDARVLPDTTGRRQQVLDAAPPAH